MDVELDPQLLEEAVFHEIRRREQLGDRALFRDYRGRVDALYDLPAGEGREIAFRDAHAEFFDRLGLEKVLRECLDEFPLLYLKLDRISFLNAATRKEEGAELFVRRDEEGSERQHRVAVLRLRAELFSHSDLFGSLLRRELYHVWDMLDPAFGYEPNLGDTEGDIVRENLLRDRYRILWSLYIDARLVRAGRAPPAILQQGRKLLERALGELAWRHADAICQAVSIAKPLTHTDLLTLARTRSAKMVTGRA